MRVSPSASLPATETGHHSGHRAGAGHRESTGRRIVGRTGRDHRDRHRAGAGIAAGTEQAEGEQVEQPGQSVDGETAGGIADGDPEGIDHPGGGRRGLRGVGPTAVGVHLRAAVNRPLGHGEGQPGTVRIDGAERTGHHAGGALGQLCGVQPGGLVVEQRRQAAEERADRVGARRPGRELLGHNRTRRRSRSDPVTGHRGGGDRRHRAGNRLGGFGIHLDGPGHHRRGPHGGQFRLRLRWPGRVRNGTLSVAGLGIGDRRDGGSGDDSGRRSGRSGAAESAFRPGSAAGHGTGCRTGPIGGRRGGPMGGRGTGVIGIGGVRGGDTRAAEQHHRADTESRGQGSQTSHEGSGGHRSPPGPSRSIGPQQTRHEQCECAVRTKGLCDRDLGHTENCERSVKPPGEPLPSPPIHVSPMHV